MGRRGGSESLMTDRQAEFGEKNGKIKLAPVQRPQPKELGWGSMYSQPRLLASAHVEQPKGAPWLSWS